MIQVQRWEYALVAFEGGKGREREVMFSDGNKWDKLADDLPDLLMRLGASGFEVVSSDGFYWPTGGGTGHTAMTIILKRPFG